MRIEGTYTAHRHAVPGRCAGQPIDWDALDALVDAQIAGGVAGLVPCGTTGESPTLTHEEHGAVVERTVEAGQGARAGRRGDGVELDARGRSRRRSTPSAPASTP